MFCRMFLLVFVSTVVSVVLSACGSQPSTHYYSLQSSMIEVSEQDKVDELSLPKHLRASLSVGIGPVKLPSMLDRYGIVSQLEGPSIKVGVYDIWAGDLQENFTTVMTELMAQNLGVETVYSEPWGARYRPQYQIRIDVHRLIGPLNGEVQLKLGWTLLGGFGDDKIATYQSDYLVNTAKIGRSVDGSYAVYVLAMNDLLARFSVDVAQALIAHLKAVAIATDTKPLQQGRALD